MSVSPPSSRALRAEAAELTIADEHRIRRRLDKLGRHPEPADLASVAREIEAGRQRLQRRAERLPELDFPAELPVSAAREEIAAAIEAHQVVVVAGETGSGKTTQLPKICLELGRGIRGAIGHTQPRRIAATSVARRIAEETGTEIGEAVGYAVRFSDRSGADTLVKVMTDGILLREIGSDPMLRAYDTIIIDEAHERSLNIDFLLGYLRRLLPRRPDLKIIITSATIEPERFARHFSTSDEQVPILEVSGRTYPVEIRYRPLGEPTGAEGDHADLDQISGIDAAIGELWSAERGDVLVFLPTERDIRETADALRHRARAGAEIVPLFARLSAADQQKVFTPSNGRRIVLATNVAETSLTVPGIRYVIDTGTARISRYSTRTKVNRLPVEPVSQASARQRAGRCGRVAPGVCIRLYSEADFESRPQFTDPEILRTNLAAVILTMISLRLGAADDFPFVDPPPARAIADGMAVLAELGAVTGDSERPRLTAVGRSLARLPVDPRLARMLVAGRDNGCLDQVLVIAAALSIPDVRERPADQREAADAAHRRFAVPGSDFLGYLELWRYLNELRDELSSNQMRRRCEREFLHWLRIREWRDLHRQLSGAVRDLGWTVTDTEPDADAVHQSLLAGLLSNVAARQADSRTYSGARGTTVAIFPGSSVARKPPPFIMAGELVETSRLFAHTVAGIDPRWAERLAGDLVKRSYSEPHWSTRRGATMAYERATLFGVVLAVERLVDYGRIDPPVARELFIRHALVQGEWRSNHRFLDHNEALLAEIADTEHRSRRRDLSLTDDELFAFYDARIPAEVVSTRHFDSWWRKTRKSEPTLLDLTADDLRRAEQPPADQFPGAWQQGETRLALRYRFEPGRADDGVTVIVPRPLLGHLRNVGFDWLVPGLRSELATELIRTLPKGIRRSMAPAQRFADLAMDRLKPRAEPLVAGLARELTAITGITVAVDDFRPEALPVHLRMHFEVVDAAGTPLGAGDDLVALRRRLGADRAAPAAKPVSRWTADTLGSLAEQRTETVAGQQITRYPAIAPAASGGVVPAVAAGPQQRDRMVTAAAATLLTEAIGPVSRKVATGLPATRALALHQQPYASVDAALADCTRRAVADLLSEKPWAAKAAALRTPADFEALRAEIAPRVRAAAPDYFGLMLDALAELTEVRAGIDRHSGTAAAADVAEQIEELIFPGFLAVTPRVHLERLPRYLAAAAARLAALPGSAARDAAGTAALDRVLERWEDRREALPEAHRERFNEYAHWLVEELRVGLFAQQLRTAYPVSEQRALRALDAYRP